MEGVFVSEVDGVLSISSLFSGLLTERGLHEKQTGAWGEKHKVRSSALQLSQRWSSEHPGIYAHEATEEDIKSRDKSSRK